MILKASPVLRVFLCHSSADKPVVRILFHLLSVDGIDPWLDEKNLLPGEDWDLAIRSAVRTSNIAIVCLSKSGTNKAGFVQKEIRYALDVADEQPQGAVFIIPLRLEPCDVPDRLRRWQWVNLYERDGLDLLCQALRARAESLGIAINLRGISQQALSLFNPSHIATYGFDSRGVLIGEIFGLTMDGKYDEAQSKLESYLKENPDYDLLYYHTQDLSERCNQKDRAIRILSNTVPQIESIQPLWAGRMLKIRGTSKITTLA